MNTRLDLLDRWLGDELGFRNYSLAPASQDASFRRYFRVSRDGESFIVMDAPPDREDCRPYIDITGRLQKCGVNVPRILNHDLEHGFLLIGDLGETLYLDVLSSENADQLYADATIALMKMQSGAAIEGLPPYSENLLIQEMELCRYWLFERHLDLKRTDSSQRILDEVFSLLTGSALEQPRVFVHRDYHSRNLLVNDSQNPGIVDFQDAVCGPVTYDLVSLFKDCYIKWPRTRVRRWLLEYYQAVDGNYLSGTGEEKFLRWFDLMGVQRQLKASGIFARLWHRDHKEGFLKDIPRTLSYILDLEDQYPELSALIALLRDDVLPALTQDSQS